MHSFLSKHRHWWPIILLVIIEIALFATNYTRGTFLMGWDNVMPEFDFKTNFLRSLVGVWQEYRGVGLYDGMSQIANLPHTLFLWFLSLFLPISLLRYVFTFLMHLLGGVGMFFLIKRVLNKTGMIPFTASLFYLFNIATIQMFYTPLEAFSVHFAALPWLALTIIDYLDSGSKRALTAFFLVALFSTPQYFVTTFFLPIILLLSVISGTHFFMKKTNRKRILTASLGFLLINAFWLLPYLYGLPHNASVIAQAKINQMSSGEAFLRNQAFGDVKNVLLMRGFSLEYEDIMPDGTFSYLMDPWRNHVFTPVTTALSWGLVGVVIIGLIVSVKKRQRIFLPFTFLFLTAFIFLGNNIPIISTVTSVFRDRIPFFDEAFRFPFTKFSLLFVFSANVLLGLAFATIPNKIKTIFVVFCIILIFYIALPAFQGNFIYKNLRISLPSEYLSLFAFMQKQDPNGRIALLPQPSYWSWKYYRFGYRGSGFVWWGLPQPTMDRAFDPWSATNENYYWELTQAIYSKNAIAVENILTKYDIKYLLIDENLLPPSDGRALFTDEIKELLATTHTIKPLRIFGKISLYERATSTRSFIAVKQSLPTVSPVYQWTDNDRAFADLGDYIATPAGEYVYPFRSLFTKRGVDERAFTIDSLKHGNLVFDTATQPSLLASSVTRCALLRPGKITAENQTDQNRSWLRFSTTNQRGCLSFGTNLSHKDAYLVEIESRHISGRPLQFALINQTAKHVESETYLLPDSDWRTSYFILPPLAPDGLGYTIYISNDAIGRQETVNDLSRVRMYTFPYDALISASSPSTINGNSFTVSQFTVFHPNTALYNISTEFSNQPKTIILYQSFDPGWVAWDGKRFLPHILVNNWANAWLGEAKIIFFWPQLLEWLGFGLLPLPFFIIIRLHNP